MPKDGQIKGYPSNVDADLEAMWNRFAGYMKERTTEIKIKALEAKVNEQDSLLTGLFKQLTVSLGGLVRLDEKLKKK